MTGPGSRKAYPRPRKHWTAGVRESLQRGERPAFGQSLLILEHPGGANTLGELQMAARGQGLTHFESV
jgi:hypothetical protein